MGQERGFTLVEILVVLAIIGVLAAVGVSRLLHARAVAEERAAQAYAANVYTVGFAYVSEKAGRAVLAADCVDGFAIGPYTITSPGANSVTACQVTPDAQGLPRVVVTASTGKVFLRP